MKIVFFNRSLMSGGIEKCIELLSYYLYKKYEIELVYTHTDKLDPHIVEILSKYAKITHLENNTIEADICIFCYLYFDIEKIMKQIKAKSYWMWIHSRPRDLENCVLDNKEFVEKVSNFICVSEEIKNNLEINKQAIVIHNFVNENIKELAKEEENPFANTKGLKLVIVSRLSEGKGFERVQKLVEVLEKKQIPYSLKIIGKGRKKEEEIRNSLQKYRQVEFVGYKDNPYYYIKNSDYLLLLSDYEAWGNVITEAKVLHVPCLVTDFPAAKEQIQNNVNGLIVKRDLENYETIVEELINKKLILKQNVSKFSYKNEIEKWESLIKNANI